ncbi:2-oxoglutarate and iron-dependent oxygenase domain-containing protein 3 [Mactra antiquata]
MAKPRKVPSPQRDKKEKAKSSGKNSAPEKEPYSMTTKVTVLGTVGLGIFLGVYFMPPIVIEESIYEAGLTVLASSTKTTPISSYEVKCSDDYQQDTFYECKPKFCGRVIMDGLVQEEEAKYLLGVAKKGLAYGGSSGGASILDLHSGALSKQDKFINIYSILPEEGGFTEEDFNMYKKVKNKIQKAISKHFKIPLSSLYLTKPTFFSRMNTTEAKTVHDEYWHKHVDKITYGSFHYTSLLYLSTYNEDFTGGRFIFVDNGKDEKTVEPRLGRVSFFTSGSENVHYVEKLESGIRYAITISFTCDPDMAINDPVVRQYNVK